MSWFTPPGKAGGTDRTHTTTGARNMRDHRERKREQAEARQGREWARDNAWMLSEPSPVVPAETPAKRKRKRKRAKKNKGSLSLAALEAATGEWLETNGPGRDF